MLVILQLYYSINIVTSILLKIDQHARYSTSQRETINNLH